MVHTAVLEKRGARALRAKRNAMRCDARLIAHSCLLCRGTAYHVAPSPNLGCIPNLRAASQHKCEQAGLGHGPPQRDGMMERRGRARAQELARGEGERGGGR